jgi:hypothetical protein
MIPFYKTTIFIIVLFLPAILFSQTKKIYLFDENKKPVKDFKITIYHKKKIKNIKSSTNNFFYLKRKYDSLKINYNFFYNKTITYKKFKKIDTLILNKSVELKPISINNKTIKIGVNEVKRRYFYSFEYIYVIRIDVQNYYNATIKKVNYFTYNKWIDQMTFKKHTSSFNRLELVLFMSDSPDPNLGKQINLLKKSYIVDVKKSDKRKEWRSIDLYQLNIQLKKYKYLYVGFKTIGNSINMGVAKKSHFNNIKAFEIPINHYEWQHLKWYHSLIKPSITVELKP